MLDFKYWITKPVAYDEYYLTKDILNLMVDKIHQYVFTNSALEFDYEESTFKEKFNPSCLGSYHPIVSINRPVGARLASCTTIR